MRSVIQRVILVAVLGLSMPFGCTRSSETGLAPGNFPPTTSYPSLDGGKLISLSDFQGKVVLLNIWATWCGPCVQEMPGLERLYAKYKDKGLVVLAVAVDDSQESVEQFRRQYGLSFPIALDDDGQIKADYQISGVPETFIIGRDGRLVLLPDPEDGELVVRITGPRRWDSPNSQVRFEKLLKK
ncbi:MAG: TlpA family protein disulfide reductase [Oligoflexia bacterium]|nr:TlpA family protein disulfide reductase [Oligoflexia bacterium]